MANIEKIRQEIERLHDYENEMYHKTKPDGRPNEGWAESLAIMGVLEELLTFIDSMPEEKLSFPFNLNDAANSYASKTECAVVACRGFKAGAEWMAEQGFISEGIIYQTPGEDTKIELNEHIGYLEDCEKVTVQIRKKEE